MYRAYLPLAESTLFRNPARVEPKGYPPLLQHRSRKVTPGKSKSRHLEQQSKTYDSCLPSFLLCFACEWATPAGPLTTQTRPRVYNKVQEVNTAGRRPRPCVLFNVWPGLSNGSCAILLHFANPAAAAPPGHPPGRPQEGGVSSRIADMFCNCIVARSSRYPPRMAGGEAGAHGECVCVAVVAADQPSRRIPPWRFYFHIFRTDCIETE